MSLLFIVLSKTTAFGVYVRRKPRVLRPCKTAEEKNLRLLYAVYTITRRQGGKVYRSVSADDIF